jgi:hypothetical protein
MYDYFDEEILTRIYNTPANTSDNIEIVGDEIIGKFSGTCRITGKENLYIGLEYGSFDEFVRQSNIYDGILVAVIDSTSNFIHKLISSMKYDESANFDRVYNVFYDFKGYLQNTQTIKQITQFTYSLDRIDGNDLKFEFLVTLYYLIEV